MNDRMITREHRQQIKCYGKREVVGHGEHAMFKVREYYGDTEVGKWVEDDTGKLTRKCNGHQCKTYAYKEDNGIVFFCVACHARRDKQARKRASDRDYNAAFSKSILKIAKAARDTYPAWNVRKGRDKDTLVYDASYGDRDTRQAALLAIARSFNCKLGSDSYVENDNYGYDRRQISVVDDNPFKDCVVDEA